MGEWKALAVFKHANVADCPIGRSQRKFKSLNNFYLELHWELERSEEKKFLLLGQKTKIFLHLRWDGIICSKLFIYFSFSEV